MKKAHAYLQTMIKTPVKFQKNREEELRSQGIYYLYTFIVFEHKKSVRNVQTLRKEYFRIQ